MTGEFVNVGLVLHVRETGTLISRARGSTGRFRDMFPSMRRETFLSMMRSLKASLDRLATEKALLAAGDCDAGVIAKRALVADESSLQWSPLGGGLTSDPAATFERLFDRMVTHYDAKQRSRRSDDDVWRPVRAKLQERHLGQILQEKSISGPVDHITFKHARKNGMWHVYEPISFDLADGEGIRSKAREWLGHLSAVNDGAIERFKPHFIVGAPSLPNLEPDFEIAKAILTRVPNGPQIFEESEIDVLVSQIEDEVRAHGSNAGARTINISD